MLKSLKIPELPERLIFGNLEHIKIVKTRELLEKLKSSNPYIRWRNEYKLYDNILYSLGDFDCEHLCDKFRNRYYELEGLINDKEMDFCTSMGINYSDINENKNICLKVNE